MKKKHNAIIHDANAAFDMGRRSFLFLPLVIILDFDFDMNRYDIIC